MVQDKIRHRGSRVGRWTAWLAILAVIAGVVAVALVSQRVWVGVAAGIGVIGAWLLIRYLRILRRRPVIAVVALAILVLVGASTYVVFWSRALPATACHLCVSGRVVTVQYTAIGQLSGDTITLQEEIVVDASALDMINEPATIAQLAVSPSWRESSQIDGHPVYTRDRRFAPSANHLVSSTVTIPIDLGSLSIQNDTVPLVPRDGSTLEVTSQKGALGAIYPTSTTIHDDPRATDSQVADVAVNHDVTDVSIAVLKSPLRNPAGQELYEAFAWGPFPWAVGVFFALLTSLLQDRLAKLLGLAARKALRRKDPRPPEPPPVARGVARVR
jgi:hypothetical protein